jgi:3',5'-cyclic AMP phosphodiesterase CpdA
MSTRIAHISDLHFMPLLREQAEALMQSVHESFPDILLVTGDLTRGGTSREFAAAAEFLAQFTIRKLILPGNHDIPIPGILDRVGSPFRRFAAFFPDEPAVLETPDLVIVGLNTAVGVQPGLDWSLGRIVRARLDVTVSLLRERNDDKFKIVATHHPLRQHALDPKRSRTSGGPAAFIRLAQAGMRMLLHGHLHRQTVTCVSTEGREVWEVGASTVLSNRERAGPAGFNLIDVDQGRWNLEIKVWKSGRYVTQSI